MKLSEVEIARMSEQFKTMSDDEIDKLYAKIAKRRIS
jgi:hypothetical protein